MIYTGNENHDISLNEASDFTENYRNSAGANPVLAHYFGKTKIQNILDQEGCVGIRMYYALTDAGQKQLVITGVDSSGNDMYNGILADRGLVCPSYCSVSNPLNS